jgi:hypothetical protein
MANKHHDVCQVELRESIHENDWEAFDLIFKSTRVVCSSDYLCSI